MAIKAVSNSPNLKWFSNTIPIASNRITIQKTHFGYQERHNSNLVSSLLETESVVL